MTWRDDKEFKNIYTAGLEFETERVSLIKTWDSRGFTRSPEFTKCAFQEVGFPRIKKKKKEDVTEVGIMIPYFKD